MALIINRKLRDKARGVVHTRFSLDPEPINPLQSLVEALAVVPARVVAEPNGRVLRDVREEAADAEEEAIEALAREIADFEDPYADVELNHREATKMVELQRSMDEMRRKVTLAEVGVAVEDDTLKGFPAKFKTTQTWRRPGVRQDVIVKRHKRFGQKV